MGAAAHRNRRRERRRRSAPRESTRPSSRLSKKTVATGHRDRQDRSTRPRLGGIEKVTSRGVRRSSTGPPAGHDPERRQIASSGCSNSSTGDSTIDDVVASRRAGVISGAACNVDTGSFGAANGGRGRCAGRSRGNCGRGQRAEACFGCAFQCAQKRSKRRPCEVSGRRSAKQAVTIPPPASAPEVGSRPRAAPPALYSFF